MGSLVTQLQERPYIALMDLTYLHWTTSARLGDTLFLDAHLGKFFQNGKKASAW